MLNRSWNITERKAQLSEHEQTCPRECFTVCRAPGAAGGLVRVVLPTPATHAIAIGLKAGGLVFGTPPFLWLFRLCCRALAGGFFLAVRSLLFVLPVHIDWDNGTLRARESRGHGIG